MIKGEFTFVVGVLSEGSPGSCRAPSVSECEACGICGLL